MTKYDLHRTTQSEYGSSSVKTRKSPRIIHVTIRSPIKRSIHPIDHSNSLETRTNSSYIDDVSIETRTTSPGSQRWPSTPKSIHSAIHLQEDKRDEINVQTKMEDHSVMKNSRSAPIRSHTSRINVGSEKLGPIGEDPKMVKNKKKRWPCSLPCLLLSLLAAIVVAGSIAGTTTGIIVASSKTTGSPISTSSSASTMTPILTNASTNLSLSVTTSTISMTVTVTNITTTSVTIAGSTTTSSATTSATIAGPSSTTSSTTTSATTTATGSTTTVTTTTSVTTTMTTSTTTVTTSTTRSTTSTTATTSTTRSTTSTTTTAPNCLTRIPFDDIANQSSTVGSVPNGYYNLNWVNVQYINASTIPSGGYQTSISLPPYVAHNPTTFPMTISSANGTRFHFNSFNTTAAWRDNLQMNIQAYRSGNMTLNATIPIFVFNETIIRCSAFSCSDIDTVIISTYGGTPRAGLNGTGTQMIMDDFCVSFGF